MKKTFILSLALVLCMGVSAKKTVGRFSVSKGHQVEFSHGNLQYCAKSNTFRFAARQHNIIGEKNERISPANRGWIDLFGWATSGYNNTKNDPDVLYWHPWDWMNRLEHSSNPKNPFGYGPSTTQAEPSMVGTSRQYDWGVFNPIKNGGNQKDMWRTLTREEWSYLLFHRKDAKKLRRLYEVKGVKGLLLLPDDFSGNAEDKFAKLEKQGAIFLPAAGMRYHLAVTDPNEQGAYWTATAAGCDAAYFLGIYTNYFSLSSELYGRNNGRSVRLVRDVH